MSAIQAAVSCGLNQVSMSARMSIFFKNNKSLTDVVLPRTDRMFVLTNLMLRLMAGPGLILTSPARRSIMANLSVGLEQGLEVTCH